MSEKSILKAVVQSPRGEQSSHADYVFWCPACKCGHGVWTTKKNGVGAVWEFNGNMEKPTFKPSLLIRHETWTPPVTSENMEQWKKQPWEQKKVAHVCHSVVTDGVIHYCGDCTHEFAGKSVPMEVF